MKMFTNGRGEIATIDGAVMFSGNDCDDASRSFNRLQDVETVFPPCAMTDRDRRVNRTACDCLAGRAPTFKPDDAERDSFRRIWDVAMKMKSEYDRIDVRDIAFSNELGVFSRDVVIAHRKGYAYILTFMTGCTESERTDSRVTPFTVFTDPSAKIGFPRAYLVGMQMCVLSSGGYLNGERFSAPLVSFPDNSRFGFFDHSHDAALMIALRSRTPWYAEWRKTLPF